MRINLDISKLKKGDVFADGLNRRYDLEFIRMKKDKIVALEDGNIVEIDYKKINLQENGYLSPREIEGEYAVGQPYERRKEKLVLVKTLFKNIKENDLYLNYRKDRNIGLMCLEPFKEYTLDPNEKEDLAKGDYSKSLKFYLYIVKDQNFVFEEAKRVRKLEYKSKREFLIKKVNDAELAYLKAKQEFQNFLQTNQ